MTTRKIVQSILSREQAEGVGARVRRSIGTRALRNLDPFLMLDEFYVKKPAGFQKHGHRGIQTVTYMLDGEVWHEDFKGHKGRIGPGDLQYMTAAKGIAHAEMPGTDKMAHGLQLWVNLSAKEKLGEPTYQEYLAKDIKSVSPEEGVDIRVIAGESYDVHSPVKTVTPTMYIDVRLKKGKKMEQVIPKSYVGFIYTLTGTAMYGGDKHKSDAHHTLVLSDNGGTTIPVESLSDDCRFVVIAGEPIKEPIIQYGPFVMNTEQEIYQAFVDYEQGKNGFEGAPEWRPTIY
ncbi:RNA pol II transcription cofactor [Umbelopsis sp. WA50703]